MTTTTVAPTRNTSGRWRQVTKREPCPACQHDHYCAWTPDGKMLKCQRGDEAVTPAGMVRAGKAEDGAIMFSKFANPQSRRPAPRQRQPRGKGEPLCLEETRRRAAWTVEQDEGPGWTLVREYVYENADGIEYARVLRFESPKHDDKTCRPIRVVPGGYQLGDPKVWLPYRLPQVLKADQILLVEGEKAVEAAESVGIVATTSAHGAKSAHKTDWSALAGKCIILWPDKDADGELYINKVMSILGRLDPLPTIKIIRPDGLAEGGDVADWLDQRDSQEPEALKAGIQAMIDAAPAEPAPEPETDNEDGETPAGADTPALADAILKAHHFAQDAGGRLYIFKGGVYVPGGESAIKVGVKRLLVNWELPHFWTKHRAEEVVGYIGVDRPRLCERPPLDVVNVLNGLLNVNTRELRPHDHAHLSPIQLPIIYDANAVCPATEKFVSEVYPSDAQALAWQLRAWLMIPYTGIQKAVLFLGERGAGKSTELRAVLNFIGRSNVAAVSLNRLESDKFAVARLVGKLANICADLPTEHLAGTSIFKAITGGDALNGERKYMESFDFVPYARLVFSANHPPRSADASEAFFMRWIVVPFSRRFAPGDGSYIAPDVLDGQLADPKELSGALNKALDALPSLRGNGFIESAIMRAAWSEFRQTTDPVAVWLAANIIEAPEGYVSKEAVEQAYNRAAQAAGRPVISKIAISKAIRERWPQIQDVQRTYNGKFGWCWLGLGFPAQEVRQ